MNKDSQAPVRLTTIHGDDILYGIRMRALEAYELAKLQSKSDCVIYPIGTFSRKQESSHRELINSDPRLTAMFDRLSMTHALPIQRYCWPHIDRESFPTLFISGRLTGKTHAHLIYLVASCIKAKPIAETNALIKSAEDLLDAQADQVGEPHANPRTLELADELSPVNLDSIDQDNFDFNTLGDSSTEKSDLQDAQNEPDKDAQLEGGLQTERVDCSSLVFHPRYIIICSSQNQVEFLDREIDRMKIAAFGDQATHLLRKNDLPPRVRTINVGHSDDKLAMRCCEGDILIGTPAALIKCLEMFYLDFSRCDKLIFDDFDLTLQLHNQRVRELINIYIAQTSDPATDETDKDSIGWPEKKTHDPCQILFFAQKWTSLVKQFICSVFTQKNIIFGSFAEASIYVNIKFELEIIRDPSSKLVNLLRLLNNTLLSNPKLKIALVCRNGEEAKDLSEKLIDRKMKVLLLPDDTSLLVLRENNKQKPAFRSSIFVMSDQALDTIFEYLTDIDHLIHYSLPEAPITFDRRFRLMYKHISGGSDHLATTIFTPHKLENESIARELYDIISRSSASLKSTQLEMRDILTNCSMKFCWRWATAGMCRLDKLTRNDRLGSFCLDKHSLTRSPRTGGSRWPSSGQIKITITHIINPNEFFFWFEAARSLDSSGKKWVPIDGSGMEFMSRFQKELNLLKDLPKSSTPLDEIRKGKIFGVYFHEETRFDRVLLLENPAQDNFYHDSHNDLAIQRILNYSRQVPALKIDHGVKVNVYLRNLVRLPETIMKVEAQCHRGLLLGIKPKESEPFWSHKATRHFSNAIKEEGINEVTAWIRLHDDGCYWLENLTCFRKLLNLDDDRSIKKGDMATELLSLSLADEAKVPSFLPPSLREKTLAKWHADKSLSLTSYAFFRKDKCLLDIYILQVKGCLRLVVRQVEYNRQLIQLESNMMADYNDGKLASLSYYESGSYCLARILESSSPQPAYTINRSRIIKAYAGTEASNRMSSCEIICLDHGDCYHVNLADLYQIPHKYLTELPMQAIECDMSSVNADSFKGNNEKLLDRAIDLIYDLTRTESNDLKPVKASLDTESNLYIYLPVADDPTRFVPLRCELERCLGIDIFSSTDLDLKKDLILKAETDQDEGEKPSDQKLEPKHYSIKEEIFEALLRQLLRETVISCELRTAGVQVAS